MLSLSNFDQFLFKLAKELPRGIKYWVIATEAMETADEKDIPSKEVTWEMMIDRLRGDS